MTHLPGENILSIYEAKYEIDGNITKAHTHGGIAVLDGKKLEGLGWKRLSDTCYQYAAPKQSPSKEDVTPPKYTRDGYSNSLFSAGKIKS